MNIIYTCFSLKYLRDCCKEYSGFLKFLKIVFQTSVFLYCVILRITNQKRPRASIRLVSVWSLRLWLLWSAILFLCIIFCYMKTLSFFFIFENLLIPHLSITIAKYRNTECSHKSQRLSDFHKMFFIIAWAYRQNGKQNILARYMNCICTYTYIFLKGL